MAPSVILSFPRAFYWSPRFLCLISAPNKVLSSSGSFDRREIMRGKQQEQLHKRQANSNIFQLGPLFLIDHEEQGKRSDFTTDPLYVCQEYCKFHSCAPHERVTMVALGQTNYNLRTNTRHISHERLFTPVGPNGFAPLSANAFGPAIRKVLQFETRKKIIAALGPRFCTGPPCPGHY